MASFPYSFVHSTLMQYLSYKRKSTDWKSEHRGHSSSTPEFQIEEDINLIKRGHRELL
jgi:hypothetical protein